MIPNKEGYIPLHLGVSRGCRKTVEALLKEQVMAQLEFSAQNGLVYLYLCLLFYLCKGLWRMDYSLFGSVEKRRLFVYLFALVLLVCFVVCACFVLLFFSKRPLHKIDIFLWISPRDMKTKK